MITKRLQGELLLLFVVAVWGASFPLMRNVLSMMPFYAYTSIRFTIAATVLVVIFWKRLKGINPNLLISGSIIGVLLFAGMYLQVMGLYFTTASNSAFITGLNVVMVPIISAYILKKRPDIQAVIGVVLAFLGIFFLSGGMKLNFNLGDILTLISALCFTFQIITIDKFTTEYDAVLLGIVQIASAAILFDILYVCTGIQPFEMSNYALLILLITALLGTALAFLVQTVVQEHTTPTRAALIIIMEPVFGAIFSSIIPNMDGKIEVLTVTSIIGCTLVLSGMLVSELPLFKRK